MHFCKEKQTQTEMTDCQSLGPYVASPTEQGGCVVACRMLESICLDIRLIQDSKKKQLY